MAQSSPSHKVELSNKTTLTLNLFGGRVYGHFRDLIRNKSVTLNLDELRTLEGVLSNAIADATVLFADENSDDAGPSTGPTGPPARRGGGGGGRGGGSSGAAAALIGDPPINNRKRHAQGGVVPKKTPAGSSPVLWEDGVDRDNAPMAPVRHARGKRAFVRQPSALKRTLFRDHNDDDLLNASQQARIDELDDGEDEFYLNVEC